MRMFVACVLLLTVLSGCGQSPNGGASASQTGPNRQIQVNQTAAEKKTINNPQEVANRLEQIALSVPNVQSANCVVFGNTAVVGVNVPPEMDRSKVGTIKLSVAEALKKDPYGVNALVTADMDLAQRLGNIRDQIRNGRPINGFAEEMAAIVGRIMPQVPRDVVDGGGDNPGDPVQNNR